MFKKKDPNTFTQYYDLLDGGNKVGYLIAEYYVTKYNDVQAQNIESVNKPSNRKFVVVCTQRIFIYNENGQSFKPRDKGCNSYENYPALINTFVQASSDSSESPKGFSIWALDYSPKTVNSKIRNSGTQGDATGSAQTSTTSNSSGSTTSQTNSFSATASMNPSATYSYSSTQSHSTSEGMSHGDSTSEHHDASDSASMSIKDWGSYASVNPATQNPTWLFGQEYPWNTVKFRDMKMDTSTNPPKAITNPQNTNQVELIIPSSEQIQLYDQVSLFPPSELSTYGVNFATKSGWMMTLDNDISDVVNFAHTINYYLASHSISTDGKSVNVYMDAQATLLACGSGNSIITSVNLPIVALETIGTPNKQAIVGFVPNKFTVQPKPCSSTAAPNAVPFKIVSTTNTLLVEDTTQYPSNSSGAGFTASQTSLTATFAKACTTLSITAYFKVVDTLKDYKLYLKHWKAGSQGLQLTITINGDTDNSIVKYVDTVESEGGEDNLLSISLRKQDYSATDYHDYLQLGLNSIEVTIKPIDTTQYADATYEIRAISVE